MAMRQPFPILWDVGFGLPVIAVVVDAGKHHGVIWLELGKSFVPQCAATALLGQRGPLAE